MKILLVVVVVLAYLGIGLLWSFLRFSRFVDSELDFYERERQQFLRDHRIRGDEIPDHLVFEWRNQVRNNQRLRNFTVPLNTQRFRSVIAFDAMLWWLSMIVDIMILTYSAVMPTIASRYRKAAEVKLEKVKRDFKG